MRSIALLLLIVNLAYLGWATLIDVRAEDPMSINAATQSNLPRLMTAAERVTPVSVAAPASQKTKTEKAVIPAVPIADGLRGAASNVATSDASTPEITRGAGPRCISVGPFQDLTTAAQASATLKSADRESRQRLEQGQVWVGYWVNIPGFAKRDEAERAVARLKQHGMTDVYISLSNADTDSSSVISLGVFKESDRAQRMLMDAKNLGFAAQVSDRTRAGSVYWVDVDVPAAETNFNFAMLGAQPGKILRLEQRPCP